VPEVRVIAPKTLLPTLVEHLGVQVYHDMGWVCATWMW